jgi:hypothetical protein
VRENIEGGGFTSGLPPFLFEDVFEDVSVFCSQLTKNVYLRTIFGFDSRIVLRN